MRLVRHPAVWVVPAGILLAFALMALNDGLYLQLINFDPQGEGEQWEWRHYREVMRHTSGVLCGHLLVFTMGALITRRHRHAVAVGIAAVSATVTGAAILGVARWLGGEGLRVGGDGQVLWEPASFESLHHWALLVAFPLYAVVGVGIGRLLTLPRKGARQVALGLVLVVGWLAIMVTGLTQNGRLNFSPVLLWVLPPIAGATTIGMAGLSYDLGSIPSLPAGGWAQASAHALVGGLAAWAAVVNVAAFTRGRRRPSNPAGVRDEPAP